MKSFPIPHDNNNFNNLMLDPFFFLDYKPLQENPHCDLYHNLFH